MTQRVRYLIKKAGLTNDFIIEHSGVGKSTISAITSDKENYKNHEIRSIDFLIWLFKHFDKLNPQWLFFGKEPMFLDLEGMGDKSLRERVAELEESNKLILLKIAKKEEEEKIMNVKIKELVELVSGITAKMNK